MGDGKTFKVLIIEDSEIAAGIISDYLTNNNYTVCGIASNYAMALRLFEEHKPELVLCDIHLDGDRNGIDFASHIKKDYPLTGVIYISSDTTDKIITKAESTRPETYLTKPFSEEQLLTTMKMVITRIEQNHPQNFGLKTKELEVLELLGKGFTNKQIAEELFISPHTVDSRRRKILEKLDLGSINNALCLAVSKGWVNLE